MGIVNRTLDASEQTFLAAETLVGTVTGRSEVAVHLPHPATAIRARISAVGLSGSPTAQLQIRRFVAGAGQTLIPLGAALALQAVSTSGPQAYTFSATALQAGDAVVVTHAGTNAACEQLHVALVMQATQDVKSWLF